MTGAGGHPREPGAAGVTGVVLAAGAGRRLGTPKALVSLDGQPLVRRACRMLTEGGCAPVIVVAGARAERVAAAAAPYATVVNPAWDSGIASSVRAGLAAVPAGSAAAVIALVDEPFVGARAVRRLLAAFHGGAGAAVATYQGRPRNPVLIARRYFDEVAAAVHGDRGARVWLRAHPELVIGVACDNTGDPWDVDTPEDLLAARARAEGGS